MKSEVRDGPAKGDGRSSLVDSSGWIEYFTDGPNARVFADPLRNADRLIVPTICMYEVFRLVLRELGEDQALRVIASMQRGREVPLSASLALAAARLAHLHKMAMADSIILATARSEDAILWTQDVDFEGMEGVQFHPKPRLDTTDSPTS